MWNWYNSFHINLHYKIQMNIIPNVSQGFFLFRQAPGEKGTDIVNVYLRSQEEPGIHELHSFIVQRAIHVSLSLASPFWAHNSNLCVTTVNIKYWVLSCVINSPILHGLTEMKRWSLPAFFNKSHKNHPIPISKFAF